MVEPLPERGHNATMRRLVLTAAIASLAIIGSCTVPERPAPPPPRPVATYVPPAPLPPPAPADWRDWPLTPGDWAYRQDARGSIALFGTPGADARMTLRCDRGAGQVYLSFKDSGAASATLRTTAATRAVPLRSTGGTPAYAAAVLAPRDTLLDAMAFSRGRFVVEQAGQTALVIPAYAEIGRVIEDCRG